MTKTIRLYESRQRNAPYPSHTPSSESEEMCRAMVAYLQKELCIADFGIEYQLFTEEDFSGKPYKTPRPGVVVGEGAKRYSRSFEDARGSAKDFANGWIAAKHS